MKTYTICALYDNNNQRYATSVQATDPIHAEVVARAQAGKALNIAGVIEGDHDCLDITKTYGHE